MRLPGVVSMGAASHGTRLVRVRSSRLSFLLKTGRFRMYEVCSTFMGRKRPSAVKNALWKLSGYSTLGEMMNRFDALASVIKALRERASKVDNELCERRDKGEFSQEECLRRIQDKWYVDVSFKYQGRMYSEGEMLLKEDVKTAIIPLLEAEEEILKESVRKKNVDEGVSWYDDFSYDEDEEVYDADEEFEHKDAWDEEVYEGEDEYDDEHLYRRYFGVGFENRHEMGSEEVADDEVVYGRSDYDDNEPTHEVTYDEGFDLGLSEADPSFMEGYRDGYRDGELDATAGDAFESNHSPSSNYSGRQRHNYDRGYTMGYEAGYGEYKSL